MKLFANSLLLEKTPHGDTVGYLIEKICSKEVSRIRYRVMHKLIRNKSLSYWRLFDTWYLISIDGSGHIGFHQRHCDQCLTRQLSNGTTYYYHPVLESKLVTGHGLALSMGTEFIENKNNKVRTAQDCEYTAFFRWAKRVKKEFPRLRICLLLDSLYACRPVMRLCERYKWRYIITFKEGSMRDVYTWYETMRDHHYQDNVKQITHNKRVQRYRWISPHRHYKDGEIFHIFECEEHREDPKKGMVKTRFVWLTNIDITNNNVDKLANRGGRLRWKIENEGFNTQKRRGYEMEHGYSRHPVGMKNFYLLMQIAHIIDQLVEKGSLLTKDMHKKLGSIRNIAHLLLEELRTSVVDSSLLDRRIQIRLNPD